MSDDCRQTTTDDDAVQEVEQQQQQCQQLATQCNELSTIASQIDADLVSTSNHVDAFVSCHDNISSSSETTATTPSSQSEPTMTSQTTDESAASVTSHDRDDVTDSSALEAVTSQDDVTTRGRGDIAGDNGVVITAEEMDMAELRVRLVCQEKANMALRMELKCAELQVAAKEKVDAKKTRLVELLDAKLAQVEKKNVHLLEMMEQLVKDKEGHSKRLVDATRNMEELGRKLTESERVKAELLKVNGELKTMLGNMEGKGSKIAQLARDKVLKYKQENDKMLQQLEQIKSAADVADAVDCSVTAADILTNLDHIQTLYHSLIDTLKTSTSEPTPTVEGLTRVIGEVVESKVVDEAFSELRGSLQAKLTSAAVSSDETAKVAELEKQNAELRESRDREVATLNDELKRLKAAIGQLVGIGSHAAAT